MPRVRRQRPALIPFSRRIPPAARLYNPTVPAAHSILFFLATVLALWGVSLAIRGIAGKRGEGARRCPGCERPLPEGLRCPACGYEAATQQELHKPVRSPAMIIAGAVAVVLGAVAGYTGNAVLGWSRGDEFRSSQFPAWNSAAAALSVFWISLFVWAWRGERPRGRRRCARCWYDMSGASSLLCPECGREAKTPADLYRPRRRRKLAALAAIAMLTAPAAWVWPRFQQGGPVAIVPSTVLIAGFEWLPQPLVYTVGAGPASALSDRADDRALWRWQETWLDARARRLFLRTDSYRVLERAARFIRLDDRQVTDRFYEVVIAGLTSGSTKDRAEATTFFYSMSWVPWDRSRGVIAAHRESLRALLQNESTPVRFAAAILLSRAQVDPEAVAAVAEIASGFPAYTFLAMHCFRDLARTEEGLELVGRLAASDRPGVRYFVARSLYPMRSDSKERSRDLLLQLLDDPDPGVATAAASQLVGFRYEGAAEAVSEALRNGRGDPGGMLRALGDAFAADLSPSLPTVIRYLDNPDPAIQGQAQRTLTIAVNSGANIDAVRPRLEELAQSPDPNLAAIARQALQSATPPSGAHQSP